MGRLDSQNSLDFGAISDSPVNVASGAELALKIREVIKTIETIATAYNSGHVAMNGDRIAHALEAAIGASCPHSGIQRVIVDMIRDAAYKADVDSGARQCATVGITCALTRALLMRTAAGYNAREAINERERMIVALQDIIASLKRRASYNDLRKIVENIAPDYADAILKALEISGISGRIYIASNASIVKPEIELRIGYVFDVVRPILSACANNEWRANDARIACIDGFCESVAELDALFTAAHEAHEPLVIFARQFAEEVLTTIAINNRRGTLNVCPIVVPYDVHGANVLKDIAIVSGGTVVSSLEGRLISTIDFSTLPIVTEVICAPRSATIIEARTAAAVSMHVKQLHKSMPNDELRQELIMRRIRALSARSVDVKIPGIDERAALSADRALRRARTAINAGVIDLERFCSSIKSLQHDIMPRDMITCISRWIETHFDEQIVPAHELITCLVYASSAASLISSTGAILT